MPASRHTSSERDEPLIRDRGDACPGALRLHRADDGFLARLRLPGGRLTGDQVELLAAAAEELGDGGIGITSRGNAELRGLRDDCAGELAGRLRAGGLLPSETHERVRNVVASPAAGLDGLGHADVQLWVRELDRLLCATPRAAALSGRFLFVLDDGRGDVAGLGGDVTLIAAEGGTALLRCAGQTVEVPGADAPRAALAAALAFLDAAETAGNGAWRVRELPPGHAPDLTALPVPGTRPVPDPPLPQPAPPTGPPAPAAAPAPAGARPPAPGPLGAVPHAPDPSTPDPQTPDPSPSAPLAPGPLGDRALHVLAPLGRLSVAQARALLPVAEVRFTPWRGVVLVGPAAGLPALAAHGFVTRPDAAAVGVTACTGRPGCAKSLADVRADAGRAPGGPLPVHFAGCERRCGHPHGTWVDVVATGDGGYLVDGVPTPRTSLSEAVHTARTTR
ncbi:cobalamin biosynthesis protein CobG [Streptomyces sp. NPDC053541]|uniref:cobalamin biosynthesis protein CobG n=1 Tax=Streptomyces sp. NPDC053541 TaxID=3365709 RepID=UPI0037D62EA0